MQNNRKDDFAGVTDYRLLKSGVECQSEDESLPWGWIRWSVPDVKKCADACREKSDCKYFIFGTGRKEGNCYWEKTENGECPEGLQEDHFDFYEIISKFWSISILTSKAYQSFDLWILYTFEIHFIRCRRR